MNAIVSYALSQGIAEITMDDGKANVMSVQMLRELSAALDRAQSDKAVVVLHGRERIFSGGFDLAVFKRDRTELLQMLEAGARLTQKLQSHPRPIVAVCRGHAVAMGVFLMLGADVRVGIDREARIHVNEVQIGLAVPRFAIEICRQRLAPSHLHHAVTLAQPYSPQDALRAGFFTDLAPAESIATLGRSRAEALAKLHPESFTETKLRLTLGARDAMQNAIRDDVADWSRMFGTAA